ncbi:hypothetical protein [Gordonia sp. (in: high G+C Gram-positive bacteria)]|uniref:hypothetical protein n=1 Tax=Gordonia sp. (in: high G+C Gram-positive bacteria) TaxID=84139 RepID=UPI003F9BE368
MSRSVERHGLFDTVAAVDRLHAELFTAATSDAPDGTELLKLDGDGGYVYVPDKHHAHTAARTALLIQGAATDWAREVGCAPSATAIIRGQFSYGFRRHGSVSFPQMIGPVINRAAKLCDALEPGYVGFDHGLLSLAPPNPGTGFRRTPEPDWTSASTTQVHDHLANHQP